MPWKEVSVVNLRKEFVDFAKNSENITRLAKTLGSAARLVTNGLSVLIVAAKPVWRICLGVQLIVQAA